MFPQLNLGFTQGPILVAHQAKHRQQLRLRKLPLAELGPLRGQNCPADFQSQLTKPRQPNFGHTPFAKAPEQLQLHCVSTDFRIDGSRMSTEPNTL